MLNFSQDALTFDDVLLVPQESNVMPKDVNLKTMLTKRIALNIPMVSSAMDTVTESRLAITLAQEGGLGVIHKNMDAYDQAQEVKKVKKYESGMVKDPVTITSQCTVRRLLEIIHNYEFSGVPVVEPDGRLVGIITSRDVRFENNLDLTVDQIMTPKEHLVTVEENFDRDEIVDLLHHHRIERVLVVDKQFRLIGMVTVTDILKAQENPKAAKDAEGQLLVGAAVGVKHEERERAMALYEAGVDVLVVDTAHGHSQLVLDQVEWLKSTLPDIDIIGGNVATAKAAQALINVGADGIKVGVGPGSICTTRIVTGVGVPQVSAIDNVVHIAQQHQVPVIADGGIRFSGDICKALGAGAHCVMIGSLLAGTDESPGEVELYRGRSYKTYRGMGSMGAMSQGSSDRYFQQAQADNNQYVPEGIEGRVPYKGSLISMIHQLMGGLRSGMGYTGSPDIDTLRHNAEFMKISSSSVGENHVHDVSIIKEAPNYWLSQG